MLSPRASSSSGGGPHRRASPWAVDLQLKRGTGSSSNKTRTQRSTRSWKQRMQERKAVFRGVAVVEAQEEEDDDDYQYDNNTYYRWMEEQGDQEDSAAAEQPEPPVSSPQQEEYKQSVLEVQRSVVLKELKQNLAKQYTGNHVLVESISNGLGSSSSRHLVDELTRKQQEQLKQEHMKVLNQRVANVYTNDHHVVDSVRQEEQEEKKENEEVATRLDKEEEEVEDYDPQGIVVPNNNDKEDSTPTTSSATNSSGSSSSKDDANHPTMAEDPSSLQSSNAILEAPSAAATEPIPSSLPMTTPTKDLPRSHYYRFTKNINKEEMDEDDDEDDDRSVFTEVTIEEIVQQMVPSSSTQSQSTNEFKDQMRKSFLAFEQLVKDHDNANNNNSSFDEMTVMTEMTMEELVEQVIIGKNTTTTAATAVPPKLQIFQQEMQKSFAAFEKLLGAEDDDEIMEEEEEEVHDITIPDNEEYDDELVVQRSPSQESNNSNSSSPLEEITDMIEATKTMVGAIPIATTENNKPSMVERDCSYDEITVMDDTTTGGGGAATAVPALGTQKPSMVDRDCSYDEVTVMDDTTTPTTPAMIEKPSMMVDRDCSYDEVTVMDETTTTPAIEKPSMMVDRDCSYDEVTVMDDTTTTMDVVPGKGGDDESNKVVPTVKPSKMERECSYDEVTVMDDKTTISKPPQIEESSQPVSTESQKMQESQPKKLSKEEKLKQFQQEMKKSFMAFESLVLKQQEDEDDDDETEYTVEEIFEQVVQSTQQEEDEAKSFAREMRNSFLAFESLLKQNNCNNGNDEDEEEESIWDEETIQESAALTAEKAPTRPNAEPNSISESPAVPKTPAKEPKQQEEPPQNEDSVASGKQDDDGNNAVEGNDDVENRERQPEPSHKRPVAEKAPAAAESPDNLLKQTQRFLSTIGGMVSFDKGADSVDQTEQETLSGETRQPEGELVKPVVVSQQPSSADDEGAIYNALPNNSNNNSAQKHPLSKRRKDGPMMIFNPLGDLLPKTPPAHEPVSPTKVNVLLNSRMFSDEGLVLNETSNHKPTKNGAPGRNLPIMNVEFDHDAYGDDDDMTQITFDHTIHETPKKVLLPASGASLKDEEASFDNVSTCSSQESKSIADLLRRDIWSPDVAAVQGALEKLGVEAAKGASYRSHIVKFGGLLGILRAMDMNQNHAGIQLAACNALERMALDPDTQVSIGGVGGIPVIANVMQNNMDDTRIQQAATAALVNISCCPQEDIDGALEAIILSMTKHGNDAEVQENSFKALANLTMDSPARLKELSNRGGLAAMTMALQKPWSNKAEHHEAISLLSMLLRNLAECSQ